MAYKKIKASEAPKRTTTRKGTYRFEVTPEWRRMKADLDEGLKPEEALQILFSEQDQKKYSIRNRRTIARFIQQYLRTQKLPYAVRSFEYRDTGTFIVLVKNPRSR
jgi:hypothetical protein